ncbi:MAG: hypothetical protein AAB599_02890 [Patescibacteria group bacterium]
MPTQYKTLGEKFPFLDKEKESLVRDLPFKHRRTRGSLVRNSIVKFGQLANMADEDLLYLRMFGEAALFDLHQALNAYQSFDEPLAQVRQPQKLTSQFSLKVSVGKYGGNVVIHNTTTDVSLAPLSLPANTEVEIIISF